jgi:hypothetical protein
LNADELERLYVSAERELLLTEKWNSIEAIAEDLDVFVTKNKKVCLDIVEVQSLIGLVIDDFWEIFKRKLMDTQQKNGRDI